MTDRPIIFSAPMVRALLDGRKSQTRRHQFDDKGKLTTWGKLAVEWANGQRDQRVYVRETWRTAKSMDAWKPKKIEEACLESGYRRPWAPIQYEADGTRENFIDEPSEPGKTRVAIHLPRWLSRLTLIVTDVRVQRLNDISETDSIAEGAPIPATDGSARDWYEDLWNSLHGQYAWAANPWVVAVSFKTIHANIDGAEARAA